MIQPDTVAENTPLGHARITSLAGFIGVEVATRHRAPYGIGPARPF